MSPKAFSEFSDNEFCCFCKLRSTDVLLGPIYKHPKHKYENRKIVVHYYCMLMASKIKQNGADEQGIAGFFPRDIISELKRGSTLHCCYCNKVGATIHCISKGCDRKFHLPCGVNKGSVHQFYDLFDSFCHLHSPKQEIPSNIMRQIKEDCIICSVPIDKRNKFSFIWPTCCKPSVLFHRRCIQTMAWNAGLLLFKCPLCNNDNLFKSEMYRLGIYIPHQDASWETEPNAFQELYVRGTGCESKNCICPKGKTFNRNKTMWQIEQCKVCGGNGVHLGCTDKWNKSKRNYNFNWLCETCKPVIIMNKPAPASSQSSGGTSAFDSESSNESSANSGQPVTQEKEVESHTTSSESGESSSVVLKPLPDQVEDEIVVIDSDDENTSSAPEVSVQESQFKPTLAATVKESLPQPPPTEARRSNLKRTRSVALQEIVSKQSPQQSLQENSVRRTPEVDNVGGLPKPLPREELQGSIPQAAPEVARQEVQKADGQSDDEVEFIGVMMCKRRRVELQSPRKRVGPQLSSNYHGQQQDEGSSRENCISHSSTSALNKDDPTNRLILASSQLTNRLTQLPRERLNFNSALYAAFGKVPNSQAPSQVLENRAPQQMELRQDVTPNSETPVNRVSHEPNKENPTVLTSVQKMKEVQGESHGGLVQQSSLNVNLSSQKSPESSKPHNAGIGLPSLKGLNFAGVSINKVKHKNPVSEDIINISSSDEESEDTDPKKGVDNLNEREKRLNEVSKANSFPSLRNLLESSIPVSETNRRSLNFVIKPNDTSTHESNVFKTSNNSLKRDSNPAMPLNTNAEEKLDPVSSKLPSSKLPSNAITPSCSPGTSKLTVENINLDNNRNENFYQSTAISFDKMKNSLSKKLPVMFANDGPSTSGIANSIQPPSIQHNNADKSNSLRRDTMETVKPDVVILSDDEEDEVPVKSDTDSVETVDTPFSSSLNSGIGSITSVVSWANQPLPFSFEDDDCIETNNQQGHAAISQNTDLNPNLEKGSSLVEPVHNKRKLDVPSSTFERVFTKSAFRSQCEEMMKIHKITNATQVPVIIRAPVSSTTVNNSLRASNPPKNNFPHT